MLIAQIKDPLADLLENLPLPRGPEVSVFEVGCGQGLRLTRLSQTKAWSVAGLDPSEKAIAAVNAAGFQGWLVLRRRCLWLIDQ